MKTVAISFPVPTMDDFRSATRSARGGFATGLTKLAKRVEPKPKKKARSKK